jgi:2-methylcitrate dehydratase
VEKFNRLARGVIDDSEIERFLDCATRLGHLAPSELDGLNVAAPSRHLATVHQSEGIF